MITSAIASEPRPTGPTSPTTLPFPESESYFLSVLALIRFLLSLGPALASVSESREYLWRNSSHDFGRL